MTIQDHRSFVAGLGTACLFVAISLGGTAPLDDDPTSPATPLPGETAAPAQLRGDDILSGPSVEEEESQGGELSRAGSMNPTRNNANAQFAHGRLFFTLVKQLELDQETRKDMDSIAREYDQVVGGYYRDTRVDREQFQRAKKEARAAEMQAVAEKLQDVMPDIESYLMRAWQLLPSDQQEALTLLFTAREEEERQKKRDRLGMDNPPSPDLESVQGLLYTFCFSCHDNGSATRDDVPNLQRAFESKLTERTVDMWKDAIEEIHDRSMPDPDQDPRMPSDEQRRQMIAGIEAHLRAVERGGSVDPMEPEMPDEGADRRRRDVDRRDQPGRDRPNPAQTLMRLDRNDDGRLSREESPQRMRERFDNIDTNGDGFIDESELAAIADRAGGRRRPGRGD